MAEINDDQLVERLVPKILASIRAKSKAVESLGIKDDLTGITTIPCYDTTGGQFKAVLVPVSALAEAAARRPSQQVQVDTFDEIFEIVNPSLWTTVWVRDIQQEFRIISLKPKVVDGVEIADMVVNEVVPESEIITRSLNPVSVAQGIAGSDKAVVTISDAIASKSAYDEETATLTLM